MTMLTGWALAFVLVIAGPGLAQTSPAPSFTIEFVDEDGEVTVADADWLAELPVVKREVRFQTLRGPSGGVFEGVELWAALEKAGLVAQGEGHPYLRQSVTATGEDGYEVLYSLGEIAPDFGAKSILIATRLDGADLPGDRSPRMVVPGDTRGARMLYKVVRITVR